MNILNKLVNNSLRSISLGTYEISCNLAKSTLDINKKIKNNKHASIIAEIKFSSPSEGKIRKRLDPTEIAQCMINGGAVGLSVLTQPYFFNGSPQIFMSIRKKFDIPMVMKDIIIDKIQIDAANKIGADYILLIKSLFDLGYMKELDEIIGYSHKFGIKVILETHEKKEFIDSLKTEADIIGINNRNLNTLKVNIHTTKKLLKNYNKSKIVVSESGIDKQDDIRFLRSCGADLFLIGTSIMKHDNIQQCVKKFVNSI